MNNNKSHMDLRYYLTPKILLHVILFIPLLLYLLFTFFATLVSQQMKFLILFVLFLLMNVLNFVEIQCLKNLNYNLYYYCIAGTVLLSFVIHFEATNRWY
jgi:hypothetical protein